MKRTIRLKESELRRMISESVKRAIRKSVRLHESIDFENSYEYYRVDIHEPDSDIDVDTQFFNHRNEAYSYAKQQCSMDSLLEADIYVCYDDWGDIHSELDLYNCNWEWLECV